MKNSMKGTAESKALNSGSTGANIVSPKKSFCVSLILPHLFYVTDFNISNGTEQINQSVVA